MAYSDYGGYAYLNGIHITERSDTSIKIDSTTEIDGHVVLGDGPIYIVLYKQYAIIYRGGERLKHSHIHLTSLMIVRSMNFLTLIITTLASISPMKITTMSMPS